MAQEGIATLPQAPENAVPSFNSALEESKQAVEQQFPGASSQYNQAIEQVIQQLNLSPDELQVLKEILELLLRDEASYPQLRQRLINEAGVRPEDIPEEFDLGYLTTMLVVVQEAINRSGGMNQGAQMPMPQGFRQGGLAEAAEALRRKGRGGDTILAHINPQEAQLLKAMGGSGTINPATGLLEFKGFNPIKEIGNAFKSIGNAVKSFVSSPIGRVVSTVALTAMLGPGAFGVAGLGLNTAVAAGLAGTAVSLAGGSNLKEALISGVVSGGMAWAAPTISAALPGAGGYLNAAATGAIMGAGYGAATGQNIAQSALAGGLTAGITSAAKGAGATGPGAEGQGNIFGADKPTEPAPVRDYSQPMTPGEGIQTLQTGQTNYSSNLVAEPPGTPFEPVRPYSSNLITEPPGALGGPALPATAATPSTTQPPTQPSPGGPMDYLTKAKDYLFSSDPKNPGFFYNKQGELSIPAVTGTLLAGGYLLGGFDQTPPAPPGIINPNVTGETLISRDPTKYLVGGIPGYTAPYSSNLVETPMYGAPRTTPYSGPVSPYPSPGGYNPYAPMRFAAKGGISNIYPRKTGKIEGPGTETSDSIPAMLSDGEFVLTARAVRGAGNGSRREGAKKLYRMMHALEKKAGGKV